MCKNAIRNTLLIGLTILILVGCRASDFISSKQINAIERGLTKQEVLTIMKGHPDNKRFNGRNEQWEYQSMVNLYPKIILIDFYQDRVVSFSTFDKPTRPSVLTPNARR